MSRQYLVFLDANVLFSAALGGPGFEVLLDLGRTGRVRLASSPSCETEARVNLERKRSDRLEHLHDVLRVVRIEEVDVGSHIAWAESLVQAGDAHVLAAARAIHADVLITGDISHFDALVARSDLPFQVRTPRAFLLEGPPKSARNSERRPPV